MRDTKEQTDAAKKWAVGAVVSVDMAPFDVVRMEREFAKVLARELAAVEGERVELSAFNESLTARAERAESSLTAANQNIFGMQVSGEQLQKQLRHMKADKEHAEAKLKAAGEALRDIEKRADREGCSSAGCDAGFANPSPWHSDRCPLAYRNIASEFFTRAALPSPTKASPAEPVNAWYCGCGHTNGCNLATCAACTRPPGGWPEEQAERYQSGGKP